MLLIWDFVLEKSGARQLNCVEWCLGFNCEFKIQDPITNHTSEGCGNLELQGSLQGDSYPQGAPSTVASLPLEREACPWGMTKE
jgi:hypothetical protein